MSIEQVQKSVNFLDGDIATLEKKKADIDKKCADLQAKINVAQKRTLCSDLLKIFNHFHDFPFHLKNI